MLTLCRSAYDTAQRSFPIGSRLVLANLQNHAEAMVEAEFPSILLGQEGRRDAESQKLLDKGGSNDLIKKLPQYLIYNWASPELVGARGT